MIEGGCFCKKIRFEITEKQEGQYRIVNCHCTMCRKTSAAPFVTWIVLPREKFSYVTGEPKLLQSSGKGTRHFCPDCGTPLAFFTTDRPNHIDVTTCSLDQPGNFVPTMAVHENSKLKWLQ